MKQGKVYLIGAGPGDPALLTLKGKQCLEEADVVVGDYLADPRLLKFMRPDAEYIYVGKKAGNHTMTQEEISQLLADKGKEGKVVARLKGGDPFVFGRGGEEIEVLRANGVTFEEVPGVTSAIAAPAYAGIPVTHRKVAASFAVITGHEDPTKARSSIHWDKLAGAVDTLIFLMGVGHTSMICEELMKYGRSPETPAAFIRWGTRPYQETYTTTVGTAAEDVEKLHIQPPAVFVVGDVVNLRKDMRWFDNRPLFGKRIIVTRSRTQASKLVEALDRKGAESIEIPTLLFKDPSDDYAEMDQAIFKLPSYRWLFFTSQNGVDYFFRRLRSQGRDARALGHVAIAAIGPATAKSLEQYGVHADVVPEQYKAEGLLDMMKDVILPGDRVLIPRAKVARRVLPEGLAAMGATVDVVEAYQTDVDTSKQEELIHTLETHGADMVTFSSSSTVHHFMALLKGHEDLMKGVHTACIGPITAATLKRYGIEPDVVSDVYTIDGLVEAMEQWYVEHKEA